jgi:hypothetical protein
VALGMSACATRREFLLLESFGEVEIGACYVSQRPLCRSPVFVWLGSQDFARLQSRLTVCGETIGIRQHPDIGPGGIRSYTER